METISILCILSASPAQVWRRILRIETLQYIAAPYATFSPVIPSTSYWREGATFDFGLRVFGCIPMGIHTVHIKRLDESTGFIQSEEHNKRVLIWNHKITLAPFGEDQTQYTDEVEIYAGRLTWIVILWAKAFYRHRQRRLRSLCQQ